MTFRLGFLLLCCTISTGCTDRSEAAPIAAPSATDPAGNALKIASLVERQCSYRSEDVEAFGAGLRTTGWAFVRTQTASKANPLELDGWRAPYFRVFRGEPLKDRAWTCSIMIEAPVAPSIGRMRAALSKIANREPGADGEWWWNPDATHKLHMTADSSGDRGRDLLINVEIYRLPWWQGILG